MGHRFKGINLIISNQILDFKSISFSEEGRIGWILHFLMYSFWHEIWKYIKNDFYEIKTVRCIVSVDGNDSCECTEIPGLY